MNPTDSNRAKRIAEWQLRAGWATAAVMLVARLTTVVLQLNRGHLDAADFGLALFKSGLLIAVVLLYSRHVWPAYLMLAVWPFGFVLARVLAHAPTSVMAVGLLVGVGCALGARGAYTLRQLRALDDASPVAV
jgi:hypothetical protein